MFSGDTAPRAHISQVNPAIHREVNGGGGEKKKKEKEVSYYPLLRHDARKGG